MVALLTRSLGAKGGAEKARYVHRSPGGATSRSYQPRLMLNALWRVSIVNLGSRFHCRCCPWLLRALVDVQLHDLDLVAHHAGNIVERSVDQRLGPRGALPVNPGIAISGSSLAVSAGLPAPLRPATLSIPTKQTHWDRYMGAS